MTKLLHCQRSQYLLLFFKQPQSQPCPPDARHFFSQITNPNMAHVHRVSEAGKQLDGAMVGGGIQEDRKESGQEYREM